jgi:hypothetical protein
MAIIDDEDAKKEIEKQVYDYWQQLISARTETFEYDVLTALQQLWSDDKVRPKAIADILNVDRDKRDKIRPERVGRLLRGMGFKSAHDEKGNIIIKDEALFVSLKRKYGLKDGLKVQKPTFSDLQSRLKDEGSEGSMGVYDDSTDSIKNRAVSSFSNENALTPPLPSKKPSNLQEKEPSKPSASMPHATNATKRGLVEAVLKAIAELEDRWGGVAPIDEVKRLALAEGILENTVDFIISEEKKRGHLVEGSRLGTIKRT